MKFLILNADDYGYCWEQTRAVTLPYKKSLVRSTSIITVAGDRDNAIDTAN